MHFPVYIGKNTNDLKIIKSELTPAIMYSFSWSLFMKPSNNNSIPIEAMDSINKYMEVTFSLFNAVNTFHTGSKGRRIT